MKPSVFYTFRHRLYAFSWTSVPKRSVRRHFYSFKPLTVVEKAKETDKAVREGKKNETSSIIHIYWSMWIFRHSSKKRCSSFFSISLSADWSNSSLFFFFLVRIFFLNNQIIFYRIIENEKKFPLKSFGRILFFIDLKRKTKRY